MEQIIQQYIPLIQQFAQSNGLNEQDYKQLIGELQELDEQTFNGVINNMKQFLSGNSSQQGKNPSLQQEMPVNDDNMQQEMQYGGLPVSMDGLYEYNSPVIVPTNGTGRITMKGINYPVEAYDADTMEYLDTMQPNQEYQFNANNVLEVPKGKFGISKMQSGGKISMDGSAIIEYLEELNNDTSEIGKKHQSIIQNFIKDYKKRGKFTNTEVKQAEQLVDQYLREKHKDDKPVNYLTPSQKYPVKSSDFKFARVPKSVEAIENPNLKTGDTVGRKPVKDFGNTNKADKFGFVKDLKRVLDKNRNDNIKDYSTWVGDWKGVIKGFETLPYKKQQEAALDWIKENKGKLNYDGVLGQLNSWGYKDSPDKLLSDGLFAEGTSLLRPSNLQKNNKDLDKLLGRGDSTDENIETPVAPEEPTTVKKPILKEDFPKEGGKYAQDDNVSMDDVLIGTLDNRDFYGRALMEEKLRNSTLKLPYFGKVDLATPKHVTINEQPYINRLYAGMNAMLQGMDENSAVAQNKKIQLMSNLRDGISNVQQDVYTKNAGLEQQTQNAITGIYNQQSQIDNQNRKLFADETDQARAMQDQRRFQLDMSLADRMAQKARDDNYRVASGFMHDNYREDVKGTSVDVYRTGQPLVTKDYGNTTDLETQLKKMLYDIEESKKNKVVKFGLKKRR